MEIPQVPSPIMTYSNTYLTSKDILLVDRYIIALCTLRFQWLSLGLYRTSRRSTQRKHKGTDKLRNLVHRKWQDETSTSTTPPTSPSVSLTLTLYPSSSSWGYRGVGYFNELVKQNERRRIGGCISVCHHPPGA